MRKHQIEHAAYEVATQIRAVEDVIDTALAEIAELQARMVRVRTTAGIGVATGHGAFEQLAAAMQGLVTAYGGVVDRVEPAHGELTSVAHDDRGVFVGVPQGFAAVRYHSLAALVVPADLEVTARGDDGTVMGVRHRTLPLEGVQFHPESVLSEHGALLVANFLGCAR